MKLESPFRSNAFDRTDVGQEASNAGPSPTPPSPLRRTVHGANKNRRKSHYPWTKDGGQVTSPRIAISTSPHRTFQNSRAISVFRRSQLGWKTYFAAIPQISGPQLPFETEPVSNQATVIHGQQFA